MEPPARLSTHSSKRSEKASSKPSARTVFFMPQDHGNGMEFTGTPEQTNLRGRKPRRFLWLKIPLALIALAFTFEVLYLGWYWFAPPWGDMRQGKIPASALIKDYEDRKADDPKLPPLRWKPITKAVPKSVGRVFLTAEDSRFYDHNGFDYQAIAAAVDYNMKKGKIVRGASTISQQTAKNLFLSLSRNPIRKWHEILLTVMLEAKLSKNEILHAYLNIAEFGIGIYGIEAASQAYFRKSASSLTQQEAVLLASTLPSPKKHNPKTMTRPFQKRSRQIAFGLRLADKYAQGKKSEGATSALPTSEELAEKLREVMADPPSDLSEVSGEELDALEAAQEEAQNPPQEAVEEAVEDPVQNIEELDNSSTETITSDPSPPVETSEPAPETPAPESPSP